ncbi:Fras1 related extracellular matrix protein [Elysia marginata]|uniref:Fras1 related extracellular matrix protein n=1 Tax=Elysia marginata TaxID=1093978 RepID=A0AAV4HNG6_9GAST|nr:Fras1 related extracellular matrix protein [Elysia marginata]
MEVDFNPCDIGIGNKAPNYLAGIHKCPKSTSCKQRAGFGLRRGGYNCVCKNGRQHPVFLDRPYRGTNIEQSTPEEYKGFICTPTDYRLVLPLVDQTVQVKLEFGGDNSGGLPADLQYVKEDKTRRRRDAGNVSSLHEVPPRGMPIVVNHETGSGLPATPAGRVDKVKVMKADTPTESSNQEKREQSPQEIMALVERLRELRESNRLHKYLKLHGSQYHFEAPATVIEDNYVEQNDIDYSVEREYEKEVKQHHRYKAFLIETNRESPKPNMSRVTQALRDDVILMRERHAQRFHANRRRPGVKSRKKRSSMFDQRAFDKWKFVNDDRSVRELFGPWAFRRRGAYYAEDTAGYSSQYVNADWFRQAKARHGANFDGVKKFKLRAYVRSNPNGTSSIKHEFFPIEYKAAPYEMGFWTKPHFRCDGKVDIWVVTYVSPFFGMDSLRTKLEFRGVTTIDVPLSFLEINQCPMPFHVPNFFKNTARCDYFSTHCRPMPGFTFSRGSYRCNCRLGFEHWHADGRGWIEGSLMELEYEKKKAGIFSRFDHLKCRPSSAVNLFPSVYIFLASLTSLLWLANT